MTKQTQAKPQTAKQLQSKEWKAEKEKALEELGVREVKLGRCPYCGTDNYSRIDSEFQDDFERVECSCNECSKDFVEYFGLDEVIFEGKGDREVWNKTLSCNDMEVIKKWAEHEGDINLKGNVDRIIRIMEGKLNEER